MYVPDFGSVILTTGLVVSGFGGNTTLKVTESIPTFPDLSVHVTVQVFTPSIELIPTKA